MADVDVDAAALAIVEHLVVQEQAGDHVKPLILGPFSAYMLVSAMQLVLRHPEYSAGMLADTIEGVARQLVDLFDDAEVREILMLGFDRSLDVEASGT